jgi:hypothetical protein
MLKTLIAALAVTFAPTMSGPSASMQDVRVFVPSPEAVEAPPARYDHAPDAPFVVIVGTPRQIHDACGGAPLPARDIIMACTFMPRRVILMPHCPAEQDAYCGKLLRHEMAHLNGWVH